MPEHHASRTGQQPAPQSSDSTLRLSHDGAHWVGSFHLALDAMCADLLSDGPLPVELTVMDSRFGSDETHVVAGELADIDSTHIVFSDGQRVDRATVLSAAF